jgi:RNA polymerase sigma-B factor
VGDSDTAPGGSQRDGANRINQMFHEYAITRDPALRAALVAAHRDLAAYLARRFANRGQPLGDLTALAERALLSSIETFDPSGGTDFLAHATTSMVAQLKGHMNNRGWALEAPRRNQQLYRSVSETVDPLAESLGRRPTIANLAAAVDASEEEVLEALEAGQAYRFAFAGLSESTGEHERVAPGPPTARPVGGSSREDDDLLGHLPVREREVVRLRFFEGISQPEIAARLGLSQTYISRVLARSLAHLRSVSEQGTAGGVGGGSSAE